MKKKVLNRVWVVLFFVTYIESLWAEPQPPGPSGTPFNPSGTGDEPAGSIDQVTIWLLVAGILLGGYYLMKIRSKIQVRE